MQRKPISMSLLPIEVAILSAALELHVRGTPDFHGYEIGRLIDAGDNIGHTTLYRALRRLEDAGLLTSQWEDGEVAAHEGRPARRYYKMTPVGEQALTQLARITTSPVWVPRTAS